MNISDIIRVPFGYLLDWLYVFTSNYGVALILFSLVVKVILLPMNIKSKKSMLKMSRVAPLAKALEAKYADDKAKYQQELMALYKEEGVSTTGGCLWSFIPLLILLPLYYVIREPITYMMHQAPEVAAQIVEVIKEQGVELGKNQYYHQLAAASYIGQFMEEIKAAVANLKPESLQVIDFSFLGIDLGGIPSWHFWSFTDWNAWGQFLLPILSGASNVLTMVVGQKLNNSVATNDKGEKDEAAAKMNQSMNMMMWIMPLFSVWIGFTMPAALSVYWIAQAIISLVFDSYMTIRYRKVYEAEDESRREIAARVAAIEAEKERVRAERRAANPDGIMENISKKKQERMEREKEEAAAREYAIRTTGIDPLAKKPGKNNNTDCLSGIPERPYCKGRAYDPNRYSKKGKASASEEE